MRSLLMEFSDFVNHLNEYKYKLKRENSGNVANCPWFRSERAHPEAVHATPPAAIFRGLEVSRRRDS